MKRWPTPPAGPITRPVDKTPHLLSAFRQMGERGHLQGQRTLVAEILQEMRRLGGSPAESLCEMMLEAGRFPLEVFSQVAVAYASLDPDLVLGRSTREQRRGFSEKGADSRRKYASSDRERWAALYQGELARYSQRRAAEIIIAREKLPGEALSTVRRALRRKRINPSD